jgi:hypothetical protein
MAHYADLTPYTYLKKTAEDVLDSTGLPTLNVGWLENGQPFTTGETSKEFQEKLREFCQPEYKVLATRGFHECEFFCREHARSNTEIRVLGAKAVYAAPTLIHHYVIAHHYQPPQEFIEAVLNSSHPSSANYVNLRKIVEGRSS